MPELHEARLLAQLQHLHEQLGQGQQKPFAKIGDGAEVRRVERDNAHEINAFATRSGDASRRMDTAGAGIEQQHAQQARSKRRLPFVLP